MVAKSERRTGFQPVPNTVYRTGYKPVLRSANRKLCQYQQIRHARADHCTVRFDIEGGEDTSDPGLLRVETVDDGLGIPDEFRAGVGLTSMRERAEEIGGTLAIQPAVERGTRVTARLPLAGGGSREE